MVTLKRMCITRRSRLASVLLIVASLFQSANAIAGEVSLATAANFAGAARALAAEFEARYNHDVTVIVGSTGKLATQIAHGAPYDILLAADSQRPAWLEETGAAVAGSRFSYAGGRLVLWSPDANAPPIDGGALLREGAFRSVAIANPLLAPYGAAAIETISAVGASAIAETHLVRTENVGQAFALAATGNADFAFVAYSQLVEKGVPEGSWWEPPSGTYAPIRQDAVLLERGADNDAAQAFLTYLQGSDARAIITQFGYEASSGD